MTEKQKMLMGILYNAEDQALIEERNHAKSLTRQFNEHWEDKGRRNYLIGQIFGSLGKNVHLEAPIYLDYGYRTTIGSDFFSNFNLSILDGGGVEIGNHVFIGPNVGIYTANHPADVKRREKGLRQIAGENEGADFILEVGSHIRFKRKLFEDYLDTASTV